MKEHLPTLAHHLATLPVGTIADIRSVEMLLTHCWEEICGSENGGMQGYKLLGRTEKLWWAPPILSFQIERHGGLVNGSSRAELQHWEVDLESLTARITKTGHRQIRKMAPRLDVRPLANQVTDLILAKSDHEFLRWKGELHVDLNIDRIIPDDACKATVQNRRKKLRCELMKHLEGFGWQMKYANRLERDR